MHGDGEQTRDFTFVSTVVAVLVQAAVGKVTSDEPVNLVFGTRHRLLDLVQVIEDEIGHPLEVHHGPVRAGDVRHSQADSSRLLALFPGIEPVPFRGRCAPDHRVVPGRGRGRRMTRRRHPAAFPPYRGTWVLDLAVLAVLAVPAGLVGLVCAVAVKLTSRGPVFFRQERIGRGRRPVLRVWKFRTMFVGDNPIVPDAARGSPSPVVGCGASRSTSCRS